MSGDDEWRRMDEYPALVFPRYEKYFSSHETRIAYSVSPDSGEMRDKILVMTRAMTSDSRNDKQIKGKNRKKIPRDDIFLSESSFHICSSSFLVIFNR